MRYVILAAFLFSGCIKSIHVYHHFPEGMDHYMLIEHCEYECE